MATSIKISQLPAKGTNLEATDLLEVSEFNGTGYVSKSITGQEIIDGASGTGVTDVTASAPLASSGGSTPNINIATANTTTTGALSSTDWNTFNGKQSALISGTNIKTLNGGSLLGSGGLSVEPVITAGTTSQYYRGDKTFQTLDKTAVGLANVDNTSDVNKPVSTAQQTALNAKQDTLVSASNIKTLNGASLLGSGGLSVEPTITAGTTSQYFRGDKTFQTLDKSAVGLANVDNTSDANKPVSTATQTALNAKQPTLVSATNIKTINGTTLLGSGDLTITSGVSSVTGTSPISSTGGATPAISIATANTSTTGALTSTDWNTFNGKQSTLVSGTNIKTINGTSVLGSGDLVVSGGSSLKFTSLQLTDGTSVTNTATDTITYSVLIPANTFTNKAFFDFTSRLTKTGVLASWNVRLYKNTSNTLTGATLIGTLGATIGQTLTYSQNLRFLRVQSSTLSFYQANLSTAGDSVSTGSIEGTTTFNLSVDNYFLLAVSSTAVVTDVIKGVMCKVLGYE
jgi:hypothetical protein